MPLCPKEENELELHSLALNPEHKQFQEGNVDSNTAISLSVFATRHSQTADKHDSLKQGVQFKQVQTV